MSVQRRDKAKFWFTRYRETHVAVKRRKAAKRNSRFVSSLSTARDGPTAFARQPVDVSVLGGKGRMFFWDGCRRRFQIAVGRGPQKPNIIVIRGDDIGWANIGVYNQGIMAGRAPNLDKLAAEGMRFTDYYAEASCTTGRANLITGELPIRTGLTTVGQAGAPLGMPDEAPTIATVLKSMGYATGQFGKNHLGDLNQFLPTLHGFDEFFGYLDHLDAMEDPCHRNYPPAMKETVGPRNMLHTWRLTWTTPRSSRAGVKSENKRSRTQESCVQNERRLWTTKS
jgi:Sulfatase